MIYDILQITLLPAIALYGIYTISKTIKHSGDPRIIHLPEDKEMEERLKNRFHQYLDNATKEPSSPST